MPKRRREQPSPQYVPEIYTPVSAQGETDIEYAVRHIKYIYWMIFISFILFIFLIIYCYLKGIPVKVR